MANKRKVQILPPEEFSQLKVGKRKKKAAGVPAVVSSFRHISKEMGVWRGFKLLAKMNQKDGFDCPGCAWPDPDGKRSGFAEYCENGAKAIAEEATEKRVTPEFFKKHSVEELSTWSDYKLGKSGRLTHPMYLAADSSHYQPISWEEAYKKIADKLKSLKSPNDAVFYTSGHFFKLLLVFSSFKQQRVKIFRFDFCNMCNGVSFFNKISLFHKPVLNLSCNDRVNHLWSLIRSQCCYFTI